MTPRATRKALAAVLSLACVSAVTAGCSSSGSSGSSSSASGPVTVQYWGWVPDMDKAIAAWNEQNPNIHVAYSQIVSGQATTKIQAAVQAGNAPCLAQVADGSMLTYVADGLLENVTSEAAQYQKNYLGWVWNQMTADGQTYGMPQDTGPIVFYYRADLFKKYGIAVPSTWAEYAADAKTIRQKDPSAVLGTLSPDDGGMFEALAWQNGADWFSTQGNSWVADITGSQTQQVASYWQGLIDAGDIKIVDRWAPTFYQDLTNGSVLSYVGAAWNASLIAQNVASESGDWRVAQMPAYDASAPTSANSGGSAVAVLKGCSNVAAALKFANWLDTSQASMNILASPSGGGLYPASTAALDYPIVNQGVAFYGGQNIYTEFKKSANSVNSNWTTSPVDTQVGATLADQLSDVALNKTTLPASLAAVQQTAVSALQSKGISVTTK